MKFIEMWYWLMNIPYYRILVVKDMEVLKTLIQPVAGSKKIKGSDVAFVDVKGKRAWLKMPESCFRDGKKFIGIVDVDNAIQMVEDTKVIVKDNGIIVKEMTITQLKSNLIELSDEKRGKMKKFITAFPTSLFFEMVSSHFVTMALVNPKEKKDYSWVLYVAGALLVGGVIYFMFMR